MAKLIGPDFLALQVRDLDVSRKFYPELLNLVPAAHSPPDAIVFDTKPIAFAIRKPLLDLTATSHLGWGYRCGCHATTSKRSIATSLPQAFQSLRLSLMGRSGTFSHSGIRTVTASQRITVFGDRQWKGLHV